MPGYDGTGPEGRGRTGRGLGPCGEGASYGSRRFFGFRRGRRGGGRGFWMPFQSPVDEETALKSEKNWLTQQLDAINARINSLEDK